ncbi:hypothetical protein JCM19037_1307 [Geomicrobium sp. JCM 19037]|uniref:hypothetical protein n=1 Tax=Geomicrobium sp. JCM 19037 TaxID=1460634 RepID=UPI00045F4623|nr:hypothetical protein [Geomicrobium sp. JCM 19037]GAK03027.1 hypothetical protein JCM19037_1307 [Geomicrobium sp. JCM 19037]
MIRKVIGSLIILLGVVGGLGIIAAGDVTFAEIGFVLLIIGIGVVTGFVRKRFYTAPLGIAPLSRWWICTYHRYNRS